MEKQLSLQAGLTAECSLLWSPFQHGGLRGDLVNGCSNLERILPNLRWYYQGGVLGVLEEAAPDVTGHCWDDIHRNKQTECMSLPPVLPFNRVALRTESNRRPAGKEKDCLQTHKLSITKQRREERVWRGHTLAD